jgi:hypothetical protein
MANWITAIAALIAAVATVAYLFATVLIFRETKKSADAAEKSAAAANKSADAAQQSVALVRLQLEQQADLGAFVVTATIDTAVSAIEEMLEPDALVNAKAQGALSRIRAVLEKQSERALNHAALINKDAAKQLSSAFDSLRTAVPEYEIFRERIARGYTPNSSGFIFTRKAAQEAFERVLAHLHDAKHALRAPTTPTF